jgi:hypothetical protein
MAIMLFSVILNGFVSPEKNCASFLQIIFVFVCVCERELGRERELLANYFGSEVSLARELPAEGNTNLSQRSEYNGVRWSPLCKDVRQKAEELLPLEATVKQRD